MAETQQWKCLECGTINTATDERHSMDYCECGETWVDYETEYSRRSIGVEYINE